MATCANFSEQLLDYLYDLLDEQQAAELRLHLQSCPPCQAELRDAEGQQRLLSQAARVCPDVAPFTVPTDAPLAEPATLPISANIPGQKQPMVSPGRSPRWVRFGAVALAASVLIAVILGQSYYSGLAERKNQVAQAGKDVGKIDATFERVQAQFDKGAKEATERLPKEFLQVHVTGVSKVDPQAGGIVNVRANDLLGRPQDAKIHFIALDAATNAKLFEQDAQCRDGAARIVLPPGLKTKSNRLQVVAMAQTSLASATIEARLRQTEPVFVSNLAISKTSYYIGELLFFRSVTLEQFSLRPITKEIPLKFALVGVDGRVVKRLDGKTGPGGVGGGEFALTTDIPSGAYFLEVASPQAGILPQRQRLEILGANTPLIVMNKEQYRVGEIPTATIYGQNQAPYAGRVESRLLNGTNGMNANVGNSYSSQNQALRAYANERGEVQLPMPQNPTESKAAVEVTVRDRNFAKTMVINIPLVPSRVMVDFFPEGGDLVDGVPTRVYYRVRSLQGDPVVPEGRLIVESSKGRVHESKPGQSVGFFSFTPSARETYRVHLSTARTEVINANPIDKLGIQPKGVVLSVPASVIAAGQPIHARLIARGESRRLVALVSCRGQIVEQQSFDAKEGETKLELRPIADVAGILRVTVSEIKNGLVVPLAERLVFRMPSRKLELTATSRNGNLGLIAGANTLTVKAADEARQSVNFFSSATLVNSQVAGDKERGLAFFALTNDVSSGAELDNANILVRDNPESKESLDLFLGTQGWRRFVAELTGPAQPAHFARAGFGGADVRGGMKPGAREPLVASEPTLVSVVSAPLASLQLQSQDKLKQALNVLRHEFLSQRALLAGEKDALVKEHDRLARGAVEFEELPARWFRIVLSVAAMLGFAVGCTLLLMGLIRMALQRSATALLAGCVGMFGLCMIVYIAGAQREWIPASIAQLHLNAWPAVAPLQDAPEAAVLAKAPGLAPGQYALGSLPKLEEARKKMEMARGAKFTAPLLAEGQARRAVTTNEVAGNFNYFQQTQQMAGPVPPMGFRFRQDADRQERTVARGGAGNFPAAKKGVKDAPKGAETEKDAVPALHGPREYAFRFQNTHERADLGYPATMLWSPILEGTQMAGAQLNFDLPDQQAVYRLTIQAHTLDGRYGSLEKTLTPAAPPPAK